MFCRSSATCAPPEAWERGLTGFPQQPQPSLGLLQGQHEGGLGRVETEATLIVALAGEVVVDAGGGGGLVQTLPTAPSALLRFSAARLLRWPGAVAPCQPEGRPEPEDPGHQAAPEGAQGLPESAQQLSSQSHGHEHPHGGGTP